MIVNYLDFRVDNKIHAADGNKLGMITKYVMLHAGLQGYVSSPPHAVRKAAINFQLLKCNYVQAIKSMTPQEGVVGSIHTFRSARFLGSISKYSLQFLCISSPRFLVVRNNHFCWL